MTRYIFTRDMWAGVEEAALSDRGFSTLLGAVLDDALCGTDRSQDLAAGSSALFLDLQLDAAAAGQQESAAAAAHSAAAEEAGPEAGRFIFTPAMWEMLQRAKLPDRKLKAVVMAAAGSVFSEEDRTAALAQNLRPVARALRKRSLEAAAGAQPHTQDELAQAYRARRLSAASTESAAPEAPGGKQERRQGMTRYIFTRDMWTGIEEAELSDHGFSRLLRAILDDAFCGVDRSQELAGGDGALFFDLRLDAAAADQQDPEAPAHSAAAEEADRFIFTPAMWEMLQRAQLPDSKFRTAVMAAAGSVFTGEDRTAALGQSLRPVARALRKRSLEAAASAANQRVQDSLAETYRKRRLSAAAVETAAQEQLPEHERPSEAAA